MVRTDKNYRMSRQLKRMLMLMKDHKKMQMLKPFFIESDMRAKSTEYAVLQKGTQ